MVGREVLLEVAKQPVEPGPPVLEIKDLTVIDDRGQTVVDSVTIDVRAKEILAIAGVQGNGQTELAEAIAGMRRSIEGTVVLDGHDITNRSAKALFTHGAGHIPEDRQEDGLVGTFPLRDNLVLNMYDRPPFARGIAIDRKAIEEVAGELVEEFDVRTPSIDVPASTLSGGNQQKLIVAREFRHSQKLLIASQPTRGLDVGSIQYIHGQIVKKRDDGVAVLLISSELDEIMALADRIAVMYQGQIVAILDRAEATRDGLGLLMAGSSLEEDSA